ncbi:MAG: MoxR family ATPase [Thermodesulfobacteriota bacterium]
MTPSAFDLRVPKPDPHFYILEEDRENLTRLEKMSHRHPVNVLVTGSQGCGKSTLVRQFAHIHNRPMATFQIGLLLESGQLFGQQRLRAGETFYQEFLFPKAIRTPGCVVHLEEINRTESPHALNELFSVLSEDRSIWIDELGFVEVAPRVMFFATMNEGEGFSGTENLDAALKDRFYRVHLEYLPPDVEKKVLVAKTSIAPGTADQVLSVVNRIRANERLAVPVSIRESLMIAEMVALGAGLREALVYSLQVSRDTLESLLLAVQVATGETDAHKGGYCKYMAEN